MNTKRFNFKKENGSVTLFVLIAMIFFLIVCFFIYTSSNNKKVSQMKELEQVKKNYEYTEEDLEGIYDDIIENTVPILKVNPNGGKWNNTTAISTIEGKIGKIITIKYTEVPECYTINFNGNGGNSPTSIKSTKTFDKWEVIGSGTLTEKQYKFGTSEGTLNAKYTDNEITLPTPTRTGYTFIGWYDAQTGGNKIGNGGEKYLPNSDITMYAQWKTNNYTIRYDNNYFKNNIMPNITDSSSYVGWRVSTTDQTIAESNAVGGTAIQITFPGYNGRSGIQKTLSNDLTVGKTYTFSVYLKASSNQNNVIIGCQQGGTTTVNLTTQWQKFTYTFVAKENQYTTFVIYSSTNESVVADRWNKGDILYIHSLQLMEGTYDNFTESSKTYNSALGTLPSPTRSGYILDGWYTSPQGGTKISTTTKVPAHNTTYYAHWTDKTIPTMGTITKNPTGWTSGNVTLTGKARDLGSGISAYQFSTNSGLTASSGGWTNIASTTSEITKTYTATSNATYYFYVKDASGNINKSSIIVNNIDRTNPTSTISAGSVSNKSVTITGKGSDSQSGVSTYKFYVGGKLISTQTTSSGTATCKYTTTFGSVTAYVIVTDTVGNTKQSSTITIWDYTIKTLAELKTFRDRVNSGTTYQGNTITQIANINIGGSSAGNWTPIGTDTHRFNGTYNGNNYTISGLYINYSTGNYSNRGLFGVTNTSANIKNLTITNASVTNISTYTGILVGYNRGRIENVKINGGTLQVGAFAGGITGYNKGGTIVSCSNSATVKYTSTLSSGAPGGVTETGWTMGGISGCNEGTIEKSINTGSITGKHTAGGIAGAQYTGTINQCVNRGAIKVNYSASGANAGGIVGINAYTGTGQITNCYNTASVTSDTNTEYHNYSGGIVGWELGDGGTSTVKNCYSIGKADKGICGNRAPSGTAQYSNNYWLSTSGASSGIGVINNDTSYSNSNANAVSKSSTEIKNLAGTLGSAFKKDTSNKNSGYPILSWQ